MQMSSLQWVVRRSRRTSLLTVAAKGLAAPAVGSIALPTGAAAAEVPMAGWVFMSPFEYQQRWGHPPEFADQAPDQVGTEIPTVAGPVHTVRQEADWATIKWDEKDLRGVETPVRVGNGALGYRHYADEHNLTSRKPIHAAFQTHKPDEDLGARQVYTSVAVDRTGKIRITIRVIVQAASSTDDRAFITPDRRNIGVITAFCVGDNRCPDWVNAA